MTNQERLIQLMGHYGLTTAMVAVITGRKTQTVRAYKCGVRNVPDDVVRMVEKHNGQ